MQTLKYKEHEAARAPGANESAKDLRIEPIARSVANEVIKTGHYSGKIAASSSLHLGVFWHGQLEGALQFGHPIDKRKSLTLVRDTLWNGFMELNRMWFGPALPKNSESRALSVSMRLIRKNLPGIKWIVSYADATQCGTGVIYRASGFYLTGIRKNNTIIYIPQMKETFTKLTFTTHNPRIFERIQRATGVDVAKLMKGAASVSNIIEALGAEVLEGYQVRYIKILDPEFEDKLSAPKLSYDRLKELDLPEGIR